MEFTLAAPDTVAPTLRTILRARAGTDFPQVPVDPKDATKGTQDDPAVDPIVHHFAMHLRAEVRAAKITMLEAALATEEAKPTPDETVQKDTLLALLRLRATQP